MIYGKFCIPVTYRCNWDCPYCITNTHKMNDRVFEYALEAARNIEKDSAVSLSGGEPGILKESQLHQIIDILHERNCKVQINSNGTIFKYPSIINKINSIYYHCSINLDIDDIIIKDYKWKTIFMVVVTDKNIKNLKTFIKKHSDIYISLIPAKKVPVKNSIGEFLSKSNNIRIYNEYKDYLTEENKKILLNFSLSEKEYKII